MTDSTAHEMALRIYQIIHHQELLEAEKRTRERVQEELRKNGLEDQMQHLFAPKDRVSDIVERFRRMEEA